MQATQMLTHSLEYAKTLSNIGTAELSQDATIPILIRKIPGTNFFDGMLPWPYVQPSSPSEFERLIEAYPNLISITGNLSPSTAMEVNRQKCITPHKEHFLYDPQLPLSLSSRARRHVRDGGKVHQFFESTKAADLVTAEIVNLYDQFLTRKNLSSTFFQFPREHFSFLLKHEYSKIFYTKDVDGAVSAIALGYGFENAIHLIHIIIADQGLMTDAGYVLMNGITDHAYQNALRVYFGGIPDQKVGGLYTFKKRWSNNTAWAHILKLNMQPQIYAELTQIHAPNFFPAYRSKA